MPRLFILSGPDTGKSVEVADGATLGRAVECAVCLHDRSVSRQHARLERSGGDWRIVDTQSRNGVTVKGRRVAQAALADGDEFLVGEVLLRFRQEPEADLEEIELEPALEPEPVLGRTTVAAMPVAPRVEPSRPGVPVQRGQGVLQYKRIPDREGFLSSDLSQHPLWVRIGAGLLALAVFAALLFLAFKGTTILRSRASGDAPAEDAR